MNSSKFTIVNLDWEQTLPLRHQVLWPDKDISFCHVDGDENALHFGITHQEAIICVASIFIKKKSARLRKFATNEDYQGQGIGSQLITHIISTLDNDYLEELWCDARKTAVDFYRRFGMQVEGNEFYKSNIAYYKMVKSLTIKK